MVLCRSAVCGTGWISAINSAVFFYSLIKWLTPVVIPAGQAVGSRSDETTGALLTVPDRFIHNILCWFQTFFVSYVFVAVHRFVTEEKLKLYLLNTGAQFMMVHNCRVQSRSRVEDRGDFSDFYMPPAVHLTEQQKRQFQQLQDEVSRQSDEVRDGYGWSRAMGRI